ncbi:MAG: hypothetical protein AABM67_21440 [Acidobacteriota bacterium]
MAPISVAGLIWLLPLFVAFAFTDRLLFWLKAFREGRLSYKHFAADPRITNETRKQIDSAWDIPIGFAGVLRALILAAASGVIDLFSTLIDGGLSEIPKQVQTTLVVTLGSLSIAFIDAARGKSIRNPGFFLKAVGVVGAVSFFRGFLLILSGLGGVKEYRPMRALLSSPIWFLSPENVSVIMRWIIASDVASNVLFRVIFPLLFFAVAMDMVRAPVTDDNVDSKNFAAAIVVVSCWFTSQWLAFFITTA